MKINFKLKDIFIVSLLVVILILSITKCNKDPEVEQSEQNVEQLDEQNRELSQAVKDSLALIPIYELRIDSLSTELAVIKRKNYQLNKEYEKLISDIDDNTVADDIELFSKYLTSRQDHFVRRDTN